MSNAFALQVITAAVQAITVNVIFPFFFCLFLSNIFVLLSVDVPDTLSVSVQVDQRFHALLIIPNDPSHQHDSKRLRITKKLNSAAVSLMTLLVPGRIRY